MNEFQIPLCMNCQTWYKTLPSAPTPQAKKLFLILKEKGLHVALEESDRHKRVDIAATEYKVHIEVDGEHHNTKAEQAQRDLLRTLYSLKDGFYTLRIPNSLIEGNVHDTANIISQILIENKKRTQPAQQQSHYQNMMAHFYRKVLNPWKMLNS